MTSPLDTLKTAAAQLAGEGEAAPEASAGDQIVALQAQIEALRERAAAEDADKPFVLRLAPGDNRIVYQVVAGETIGDIAANFGLASPYQEVFKPNMAEIEASARDAGYPGGSDQGAILPAGTWLILPASSVATKPE